MRERTRFPQSAIYLHVYCCCLLGGQKVQKLSRDINHKRHPPGASMVHGNRAYDTSFRVPPQWVQKMTIFEYKIWWTVCLLLSLDGQCVSFYRLPSFLLPVKIPSVCRLPFPSRRSNLGYGYSKIINHKRHPPGASMVKGCRCHSTTVSKEVIERRYGAGSLIRTRFELGVRIRIRILDLLHLRIRIHIRTGFPRHPLQGLKKFPSPRWQPLVTVLPEVIKSTHPLFGTIVSAEDLLDQNIHIHTWYMDTVMVTYTHILDWTLTFSCQTTFISASFEIMNCVCPFLQYVTWQHLRCLWWIDINCCLLSVVYDESILIVVFSVAKSTKIIPWVMGTQKRTQKSTEVPTQDEWQTPWMTNTRQ
jgi:hypothetical protein